jgi:hypothetical protein
MAQIGGPWGLARSDITSTYNGYKETHKIGADTTSPLKLKKGLRQGSVLSPILFIIYVNDMLKELQTIVEGAVTVGLSDLDRTAGLMFVDELHLMAQSIEGQQQFIVTLIRRCRKERQKSTLLLTKNNMKTSRQKSY